MIFPKSRRLSDVFQTFDGSLSARRKSQLHAYCATIRMNDSCPRKVTFPGRPIISSRIFFATKWTAYSSESSPIDNVGAMFDHSARLRVMTISGEEETDPEYFEVFRSDIFRL